MITLYGWGPVFDCPSPSNYVMKTDIQLQMLGLDFDRAIADLESVPKHKAPYVMDGDTLVQVSNFIRAHFERMLGKSLDAGLTDEQRAASWALKRMQLAEWGLQALAIQLAAKPFLFGDRPTAADASVSAVLISCATEFFETPLSDLLRDHTNLVGYMDRMTTQYFAKNRWPVSEMA
ncbi:glutathione S-transferase family protein [Hyphomonas sp.]|jgi:hypothetical protein|uniref:glutathione S-transferase family protein n=1 Tax=Hyphomonas sp. TaxID=87 RepID=UPI0039E61108